MTEEWKEIKGFNGKYLVSSKGKVISLNYNKIKILKQKVNKKTGQYEVTLSKDIISW